MVLDALVHPRGPEPPGVYWRRRAVLLGVVVLLLVLLVRSCGGDGGDTLGVRDPSPSPSAGPAVTPSVRPSASPSTGPSTGPSPSRSPGGPCRPAELRVAATADARTYPTGVRPQFTLAVTNVGPAACVYDVGPAATELRVLSGSDRIWSSDDCNPAKDGRRVLLRPNQPETTTLTWSRRRSAPGCPAERPEAAPGTYRLVGRVGGLTVQGDVFSLR